MNWDAVAAIAELLGACGVIASLVYLGTQVRSSVSQSRQAAAQSVQAKINSQLEALAGNPVLADLYVRGLRGGFSAISETEAMQLSAFYLALIRAYEELLNYHKAGAVDEWAWATVRSTVLATASSAGFADWWAARGTWFSEDFQQHVAAEFKFGERRDLASELRGRGV